MKIVLIGAGSHCFALGQISDVLTSSELKDRNLTLALVDENAAALEAMTRLARRACEHVNSKVVIESHQERCAALPGADYVLIAVARRRWELWEQDFRVPLSFGFRQALGENGGPGALFHALRSFNIVIPICRDIERLCPNALVFNFTNPEARVLHAICNLTKVKAVGICHGIFGALNKISEYLNRPLEELKIVSAGMNHFYCILRVVDKKNNRNLLPELLQKAVQDSSPAISPLFKKFAEIFDVFTFPSEDHIGEYVSFGAEFLGTQWHYGIEKRKLQIVEPTKPDVIQEYADGRRPIDFAAILRPSGEIAVPLICDIELNRRVPRPAVNVLNKEGYISNLPREAVVEVPCQADAQGIHPEMVGALPESFAVLMRPHFAIHTLLTEAYRTRSHKLLLQALLLDPNVNSITNAERMLAEMLRLQSDFLPEFE